MKKIIAIAAALCFAALPAQARTINFADYAAGNEGAIEANSEVDFGFGDIIWFVSASHMMVTPTSGSARTAFNPYFDDSSDGSAGGLGVCRNVSGAAGNGAPGSPCASQNDVGFDGEGGVSEGIILEFRREKIYDIQALSFRGADGASINASTGQVKFLVSGEGGFLAGVTSFANLVAMAAAGDFLGVRSIWLGHEDTNFLLEAFSFETRLAVPVPAALPLLLSGLASLGFASRRKKNA